MKHRITPLLLIAASALAFCLPSIAKDEARFTPKKHYALGYIADEGWTKGTVGFENSPFRATPVAPSADLTALLPPDDDQGQVGRCTGFGLAHGVYAAVLKQRGLALDFIPSLPTFSPNFIYYNERVIMGTVTQDSGAMIGADGITTLKAAGACLLTTWPTNLANQQDYLKKPSAAAYTEGKKHLVLQAYKVDNRNGQNFEQAMSSGFVVVIGITLHSEFEGLNAQNYTYHGKGAVIGGHCMVAYKYDLKTGMVTIHNQWGDSWGLHDTYQMPLSIIHSSAVDDCWVIQAVAVPAAQAQNKISNIVPFPARVAAKPLKKAA